MQVNREKIFDDGERTNSPGGNCLPMK